MVDTFANAIARRDQQWTVIVRVEGLGDYAGIYSWCSTIPPYAYIGAELWFADLMSWPELLNEKVPPIGGVPDPGSTSVDILDYRQQNGTDLLTAAMRFERASVTQLTSAITSSSSSISFADATNIPATGVVWIGNEALRITSGSGLSRNVTRGWLMTDAQAHDNGSPIYISCPYLKTRRLSVYLAPIDGDTSATELLISQYRIDPIDLGEKLGSYVLGGATQLKYLGRDVASSPIIKQILATTYNGGNSLAWIRREPGAWPASSFMPWPDGQIFLKVSEEIVRCSLADLNAPEIQARAQAGTERADHVPGDPITQVCVADAIYGSFRYSPGPSPSTSQSSGTWVVSQNWVDILLNVLTSSAHPDDGLSFLNYSSGQNNYSSLPIGFGIGYPAALIDWTSFMAVRARTRDYNFPNAIVGDKRKPFAKWVNENFLEPIGAFITNVNGVLQLVLPRIPLAGETATAIGVNDILSLDKVGLQTSVLSGSVTYKIKGPNGTENELTFKASDYAATFGQRGLYTYDENALEITVDSLRSDEAGLSGLLVKLAMRRLIRFARPMLEIRVTLDVSFINSGDVGSLWSVTHPDIPNFSTGTRGISQVIFQCLERKVSIDPDRGPTVTLTLVGYGNPGVARICPSASVVSSAANGGNRDVVIAANRYTSPDAGAMGLPTTDAAAFTPNDVVIEKTRAGVNVGSTRTVVAINTGTNTLTLSGAGAPTAGNIITYADYSASIGQQQSAFVYWADEGTGQITAGVDAWRYGEG